MFLFISYNKTSSDYADAIIAFVIDMILGVKLSF